MEKMVTRTRLVLGAAALLALIVVPVALAATGGDSQATASAVGVKKKVKQLTQRVDELTQRLATVEQEQGGARPPTGAAGGDLTGAYPNPEIGAGAVNSAKVSDNSLSGADIDPQTTIRLSGLVGPPPGSPQFAVLSAAEGLSTGASSPGVDFSTEVGIGGVQVSGFAAGDGSSARLTRSRLFIDDDEFGARVTFGPRSPFAELTPHESRYDSAITLPEGDTLEEGDPGNPPADSATIYVRDDGTGLTQVVARFADGDIDVLAEEAP